MRRHLVAVVVALSCADIARAQDGVFRARVESVLVDALVTEGNNVVQGLGKDDFELFDDGVRQDVELLRVDEVPLNVVLALDVSESVAGDRLASLVRASGALLGALKPGDQAALVSFSERVRVVAPLSNRIDEVRAALRRLTSDGTTSLNDGLYTALQVGEGDVGRALVIVFSDGADTASWLTDERLIDTIKRSDSVVYGATVRTKVKPELLAEVTSLSGGHLHEIERLQNLEATFLGILAEFRTRYVLSYSPKAQKNGWHTIEVRVKNRRATVRARPGYLSGS